MLKQGGKSTALEKAFSDGTSLAFKQDSSSNGGAQSLLDLDMPTSNQGGQDSLKDKVNKVENALEKLRRIESERNETLQDLREKVDIVLLWMKAFVIHIFCSSHWMMIFQMS